MTIEKIYEASINYIGLHMGDLNRPNWFKPLVRFVDSYEDEAYPIETPTPEELKKFREEQEIDH